MKGRAFAAVVLSALLLLSGLGIGGWWLLWQRGPLQLAHQPLALPRAARFVPATASFSLYLLSDAQRPVDYARAVAPARQRRQAGEAIARLRDGAFAAAGLDYQDELAGWLGGDIAMALFEDPVAAATGAPPEQPARGWLLALASRDDDGARRFLQRFWQTRSLAGTDLQVSRYRGMGLISGQGALVGSQPQPLATALVDDDLVLIASGRNLLERALDVSQIAELNQAGQPLLREGVAAFGSGAALAVASPQALHSWLGLPAAETTDVAAMPLALSQAAAVARGLPRTAALAAALPDPPDAGSAAAELPGGSSPAAAQSPAGATDAAPRVTDGRGAQAGTAAPAGDGQPLERSGTPRLAPAAASPAPEPEVAAASPAAAALPPESVPPTQDASRQQEAPRFSSPGAATLPPGAAAQASPERPAEPTVGPAPAGSAPLPPSSSAIPSASQPSPPSRASQPQAPPSPAAERIPASSSPQSSASQRPAAAPAPVAPSPSPSVSRAASPLPSDKPPAEKPPAAKLQPPTAAPAAETPRLNPAAAPSLLAVLQPQGRQLELRARLLLPGAPRLTPVQPELAELLVAALRGSPSSLALIQDPAALAQQPLLRPLLQRSLGLRPQARAEGQGPLPALLARSVHGPLLASQAPEGWQLATRAGDPAAAELEPLLSQAGLLEAPLTVEGHSLRVWTRLSPPGRSGRSGRTGADALVAPLAGWSEPRQQLAWWGQTLAALDAPAETGPLTALRRGLRELGAPQAPLQWSVDADTARALLRAWQPWRLLSALAGGGLDAPVRGLALAVDAPPELAGLELRARLSLGS